MKIFIRVIKETLRLYPPVAFMGRELREPLVVSGKLFKDPNHFLYFIL